MLKFKFKIDYFFAVLKLKTVNSKLDQLAVCPGIASDRSIDIEIDIQREQERERKRHHVYEGDQVAEGSSGSSSYPGECSTYIQTDT